MRATEQDEAVGVQECRLPESRRRGHRLYAADGTKCVPDAGSRPSDPAAFFFPALDFGMGKWYADAS
ncbi:MAG: hypothetical protein IJR99_00280 [Kiritimatiellae bacterium]|nr:hypothetical protein [Kiritimatiellia bacterium]